MSTHLVKHKKITKRQMKEDPLVTAAGQAMDQWGRHGSRILIVAGIAALAGILIFLMAQARAKAEVKASGELYRATLVVNQGDYTSAAQMLKEIVDNEPRTDAARDAMLYLGDAMMGQKKASEAAPWYRKYIEKAGGDREKKRIGNFALGTALEDTGEFRQAADAYGESAKQSATVNERGRAMLSQARCMLRAGQTAQASDLYKAIVALPGAETPIVDAANVQLGGIQAAAPSK